MHCISDAGFHGIVPRTLVIKNMLPSVIIMKMNHILSIEQLSSFDRSMDRNAKMNVPPGDYWAFTQIIFLLASQTRPNANLIQKGIKSHSAQY